VVEEVEEVEEVAEEVVEEVVEGAEAEEEQQPSHLNQSPLPLEMESWKEKNPPSSLAIELKPMSSCTNSNFINSSIRMPRL
jgi:hypothetical protein